MNAPQPRSVEPEDHAQIVTLNNAHLPAVTPLDGLDDFVAWDAVMLATGPVGDPDAFLLGLGPGVDAYASVNYRWFSERYDDFAYVDRVVVAADARRGGQGRALYAALLEARPAPVLLAEVNIVPRNDDSLRFHDSLGFVAVGQQDTPDAKRVVMLARSS